MFDESLVEIKRVLVVSTAHITRIDSTRRSQKLLRHARLLTLTRNLREVFNL